MPRSAHLSAGVDDVPQDVAELALDGKVLGYLQDLEDRRIDAVLPFGLAHVVQ